MCLPINLSNLVLSIAGQAPFAFHPQSIHFSGVASSTAPCCLCLTQHSAAKDVQMTPSVSPVSSSRSISHAAMAGEASMSRTPSARLRSHHSCTTACSTRLPTHLHTQSCCLHLWEKNLHYFQDNFTIGQSPAPTPRSNSVGQQVWLC